MNANKFINNCKGHKSNAMSCNVIGVSAVTKGCEEKGNGVICVNQKQSGQKITEKDCTDLQSLVKKSVDDINVLFSLKHIQSSFAGVDGYKRKHQSLSVGKNVQQRFNNNNNGSGSSNKKQQQEQQQQQNFTLNINNYINASSSSSSNQMKKNTLTIERYNDDNDCSYDNNTTARITNNVKDGHTNNNHHVMNLNLVKGTNNNNNNNNSNSNSHRKGIVDKKDKRERSINGVLISGSEKKKPSYQSYVNVKKKCTKRLYGNDCNNSVSVNMNNNNNINDVSMYANSSRGSGVKGNIKTNRNVSPIHMESSTYRGNNTNNKCKSGLTKKNHFNSAHTSRKLFNKVNQFQQQQQQQTSFIHQNQSNNTKQHNSTFTSISQLDMMLTQTQQPSQSALTKTISREIDLNYNPTISLTATSTSFTNSASTNTNQQQQQPLSSSSNIIKVQKARSSSITSSLTNSTNLNTSLTTTSTRTRHNPSPLHKPSSSLFFSSSNYHSIINKIYSKEFPYNALTTNDILKLMLFLNEYLINSNVLKDTLNPQHIQLLSNYSSFLSENITLDYPETEDIDHSKLDKVVNCTKMIQRKWREFTMRTYLSNNSNNSSNTSSSKDEIHEIKKMVLNTYIHRTGFKVKKIIGLFNSTCEAFSDIVNDTEMNEMMYNIIKLIKGKLTKCEKHLLYKQYINNIIFNHVM